MELHNGVVAVGLVGMGMLYLVQLPKAWRNEGNALNPHRPFAAWPFGAPLWRGWLRAATVSAFTSVLLGIWVAIDSSSLNSSAWGIAAGGLLGLVFAGFTLGASITLFNRPKNLVVPHLRNQPGALAEWQGVEVPPAPPPRLSGRRRAHWW